jgi:hypothetical protein
VLARWAGDPARAEPPRAGDGYADGDYFRALGGGGLSRDSPGLTGTLRVTSMGQPLAVQSGAAITAPGAATLLPTSMQTRVQAM